MTVAQAVQVDVAFSRLAVAWSTLRDEFTRSGPQRSMATCTHSTSPIPWPESAAIDPIFAL